jgi:DNA-binding transcriptional ArsR family regulator
VLETLSALAEPNRLRIVDLLRSGPRAVGEIGEKLKLRQPQVSKHLRVLREARLVEVSADAQRRLYELRPQALRELDSWLEPYRRFWNAHLDRLERHLDTLDGSPTPRTRRRPK